MRLSILLSLVETSLASGVGTFDFCFSVELNSVHVVYFCLAASMLALCWSVAKPFEAIPLQM